MATVGRDVLTRRAGFRRRRVAVPEWGGDVAIRELSAGEVLQISAIQAEGGKTSTRAVLAHMLVFGWIDDDGANLFTAADSDDLLALPAAIVTRIANEISTLSGSGPVVGADGELIDPVSDSKNA